MHNATAGAVRVETNLPETSTVIAQSLSLKHNQKMFDMENEGKSDGAQHAQWRHSIANINLYKSHPQNFYDCFDHYRDKIVSTLW